MSRVLIPEILLYTNKYYYYYYVVCFAVPDAGRLHGASQCCEDPGVSSAPHGPPRRELPRTTRGRYDETSAQTRHAGNCILTYLDLDPPVPLGAWSDDKSPSVSVTGDPS